MSYVWDALPADMKLVIKTVNKKTGSGNKETTLRTDSMKLFLLSFAELNGRTDSSWNYQSEGFTYPIFTTKQSRIKARILMGETIDGDAYTYWQRSPMKMSTDQFGAVAIDGTESNGSYADASLGVCFGFCV